MASTLRHFTIAIAVLLTISGCGRAEKGQTSTAEMPPAYPKSKAGDAIPLEPVGRTYFPLVDGVNYAFVGSHNGKTERHTLLLRRHESHGRSYFYFDEDGDNNLLTGCMCGHGAYDLVGNGIRTAKVSWRDDLDHVQLDGAQLMLNLPPRVGDATVIKDGGNTRRFVVEAFEDVRVPAGLFERCARIRIEDEWPSVQYTGRVWLADGIGMIKWHRGTGRTDELVSVSKSPAK